MRRQSEESLGLRHDADELEAKAWEDDAEVTAVTQVLGTVPPSHRAALIVLLAVVAVGGVVAMAAMGAIPSWW